MCIVLRKSRGKLFVTNELRLWEQTNRNGHATTSVKMEVDKGEKRVTRKELRLLL